MLGCSAFSGAFFRLGLDRSIGFVALQRAAVAADCSRDL